MRIDVLTLFPGMFSPLMKESIIGRAVENRIIDISVTDIRDHTVDKHKKTDDEPFGGGAGMLMTADPVFRALEAMETPGRMIYMSPKGRLLNPALIEELSKEKNLILLCGRYEGIDERIITHWGMEEISIGDYILTGGELAAMVLIDAVGRLLPGVLGSSESHKEESIYSGILEYPQYTRPREYRGLNVPEVLLSGNHSEINLWRYEQALCLTLKRRPDLLKAYINRDNQLDKDEKRILEGIKERLDT